MKLLIVFLIGLNLGMFCNSKEGADIGWKAGRWTREMLSYSMNTNGSERRAEEIL